MTRFFSVATSSLDPFLPTTRRARSIRFFRSGLRSKAFASISSMPFEGPPFISNMRAISRGSMLSSACAASAPKPSKW